MQIQTERGLISVKEYAATDNEAINKGYAYAFTSHQINAHCYSKIIGKNLREFCLVKITS